MVVQAAQRTALVRRAHRINRELARLYPDARIELNFIASGVTGECRSKRPEMTARPWSSRRTLANYTRSLQR